MVTAYLDESGSHASPDWCVVAGFLGNDEQWLEFERAWKLALGKRNGLHMHRLRWGNPRTSRFLQKIGELPERFGLRRIFGCVRHQDYADLVTGSIRKQLSSPYLIAIHPCIFNTMRCVPSGERVKFVFEKQDEYSWVAELHLNFYSQLFPGQIAGIDYVPKDSTVLTQPADYLAYKIYQSKLNWNSKKAQMGRSILGNRTMIGADISRNEIKQIAHQFMAMIRRS